MKLTKDISDNISNQIMKILEDAGIDSFAVAFSGEDPDKNDGARCNQIIMRVDPQELDHFMHLFKRSMIEGVLHALGMNVSVMSGEQLVEALTKHANADVASLSKDKLKTKTFH